MIAAERSLTQEIASKAVNNSIRRHFDTMSRTNTIQ